MLQAWDGIRKVHSASSGLDVAKAGRFIADLGPYLSNSLLSELKKAVIEGPIHMDAQRSDGEYRGSLVKRIDGYLWKNHGFSFHEKGNILNDVFTNATKEVVAFDMYGRLDPSFNWTPGDMGDGRSCFWLSHAIARYWMKEWEHAYGFQLYQNIEKPSKKTVERPYHKSPMFQEGKCYTGYGRCWTFWNWPYEDCVLVFNAYPGDHLLNTFAQAIITGIAGTDPKKASSLIMKKVMFVNTGSKSNWFYTNSGHAMIIGTEAALKKVGAEVDLKREKPDYESLKDYAGKCIYGCSRFAWKDRPSIWDSQSGQVLAICEQCVFKHHQSHFVACNICGEETFFKANYAHFDVCAKPVLRQRDSSRIIVCPSCHDELDLDQYHSDYKQAKKVSPARQHLSQREDFDMKYCAEALAQIG